MAPKHIQKIELPRQKMVLFLGPHVALEKSVKAKIQSDYSPLSLQSHKSIYAIYAFQILAVTESTRTARPPTD